MANYPRGSEWRKQDLHVHLPGTKLLNGYEDDDDIKEELKADLIALLAEYNYPPIVLDEVNKGIFEQAENFKRHKDA